MASIEFIFGNGTDRTFVLTHALGTSSPLWALYRSTGEEVQQGEAHAQAIDGNRFRFTFATAPAPNNLRVVFFTPQPTGTAVDAAPGGTSFFAAFNASLDVAEAVMGEVWSFGAQNWNAIEIENVTTEMQAMPGGRFRNVSVILHVRLAVFLASGVRDSSILTVRGDRVRVNRIDKEGDDARVLYCGPTQIDTSGLL